ncbi:hypothetical protein P7K49_036549 [Saguinus oedipus]|uniref:Uncharacterized protein n=1 Tax=Saguinus oedipus TaxID=9490 RepID=A0ABQ9TKE7_SAGOE|nr:hypothetical protein P7K49_036549 [Saguinus oedipus]
MRGPGIRRAQKAAWVEKPFESPLPLPIPRHSPPIGRLLEVRGRARLILNRRPALLCRRPEADLCTDSGRRNTTTPRLPASPAASSAGEEERESVWVPSPAPSLSWEPPRIPSPAAGPASERWREG